MAKGTTYAITVYEDHSIEKEEYTLYGINLNRVQDTITNCLKGNKSFRVIVFNEE
jgi:hypothetical protein